MGGKAPDGMAICALLGRKEVALGQAFGWLKAGAVRNAQRAGDEGNGDAKEEQAGRIYLWRYLSVASVRDRTWSFL